MNVRINSYSFGAMTIGRKVYTRDLIIYPDGRIQANWWRDQGHHLIPDDITDVLDLGPARLIIGTGANGLMHVSEKLLEMCNTRGIDVESYPTATAVARFNEVAAEDVTLAACFHLTC